MLEAGLCGLPTLAADLEGIADVVHEGRNGHRLPSGDADAFARAILRYHADRAALARASAAASAFTAATFSWQGVTEQLLGVLRATRRRRE